MKNLVVTDHHMRTAVVLAVVAFFAVFGLFARCGRQEVVYAVAKQTSQPALVSEPVKPVESANPVTLDSIQLQQIKTTIIESTDEEFLGPEEKELLKEFDDFSAGVKPLPTAEEVKEKNPLPMDDDYSISKISMISVSSLSEVELVDVYSKYILEDRPETGEAKAREWARLYVEHEEIYDLPRGILVSIGHVESTHDPNAKSCAEAYGLLQVQLQTGEEVAERLDILAPPKLAKSAKEKEVKVFRAKYREFRKKLIKVLKSPDSNVRMGSFVLNRFLKKKQGDWTQALQGYSGNARNYAGKVRTFHFRVWQELENRARASALAQDKHFRAENNPLA